MIVVAAIFAWAATMSYETNPKQSVILAAFCVLFWFGAVALGFAHKSKKVMVGLMILLVLSIPPARAQTLYTAPAQLTAVYVPAGMPVRFTDSTLESKQFYRARIHFD